MVPGTNPLSSSNLLGNLELAFDLIPDGSVSSICGNTAKGLSADFGQEFDSPGCATLSVAGAENGVPTTGNSMVVSTELVLDIDNAINDFMSTFNRVLECQPTSALVPCLTLADTMPVGQETPTVDLLGTGLVIAVIGNVLPIQAGGQLSMIFYNAVSSGSLSPVTQTTDLNDAVASIAQQISTRFKQLPDSNFMVFDAAIGGTGLAIKAVVDIGLFGYKDGRGKNLGHSMTDAEWLIVIFDLVSDAISFSVNVLAAAYSAETLGHGQTPDIFISIVLGIPI
jgi:hypothetical protein